MNSGSPAANLGIAVLGAGPAGLTAAHVHSLRDPDAALGGIDLFSDLVSQEFPR